MKTNNGLYVHVLLLMIVFVAIAASMKGVLTQEVVVITINEKSSALWASPLSYLDYNVSARVERKSLGFWESRDVVVANNANSTNRLQTFVDWLADKNITLTLFHQVIIVNQTGYVVYNRTLDIIRNDVRDKSISFCVNPDEIYGNFTITVRLIVHIEYNYLDTHLVFEKSFEKIKTITLAAQPKEYVLEG